MATKQRGSYLAAGKKRYFDIERTGNQKSRFRGEFISQSAYKKLGGRALTQDQFRQAERSEKNPLTVWGGGHDVIEEKNIWGTKRKEKLTSLTGLRDVRTKVGDASLLSETMKAYANPYLLFRTLGVEGTLEYQSTQGTFRTGLRGQYKASSDVFEGPKTTAQFEYMIDQDTQEAVLDYERSARSAFTNSFFSREY